MPSTLDAFAKFPHVDDISGIKQFCDEAAQGGGNPGGNQGSDPSSSPGAGGSGTPTSSPPGGGGNSSGGGSGSDSSSRSNAPAATTTGLSGTGETANAGMRAGAANSGLGWIAGLIGVGLSVVVVA